MTGKLHESDTFKTLCHKGSSPSPSFEISGTCYNKKRQSQRVVSILCGQQLQLVRSHVREPICRQHYKAHVSDTSICTIECLFPT